MTLALIDGDGVAYRAAVVQQQTVRWDSETVSTAMTGSEKEAAEAALETLRAWAALSGCRHIRVAFGGRTNWRKRILPSYKANRTVAKPLAYVYTVNAVKQRFQTDVVEGLEGDDVVGILATTDRYAGDCIVMSMDKDLRTIPGRHLNPLKETKPVVITPEEADYRWLMQTLTGDSSDGYKGCPKIGEVKAEAILKGRREVGVMWPKVVAAFRKAKLTENDALVQARVARILRRSDYDRATKEVLLWHPKTPERIPVESE